MGRRSIIVAGALVLLFATSSPSLAATPGSVSVEATVLARTSVREMSSGELMVLTNAPFEVTFETSTGTQSHRYGKTGARGIVIDGPAPGQGYSVVVSR
ncbi:MAG: hypothetical protein WBI63_04810 [Coriobacteriia bacterium]